jgi:hypothetical protein
MRLAYVEIQQAQTFGKKALLGGIKINGSCCPYSLYGYLAVRQDGLIARAARHALNQRTTICLRLGVIRLKEC